MTSPSLVVSVAVLTSPFSDIGVINTALFTPLATFSRHRVKSPPLDTLLANYFTSGVKYSYSDTPIVTFYRHRVKSPPLDTPTISKKGIS